MKRPSKNSKPKQRSQRAEPRGSASAPGAEAPSTSGRKWVFRLVALVIIPLILLVGIEAGLRLAGYGYDPGLFKKIKIGGGEFFVNNENFGLRFFPPQLTRGPGRSACR